MTTHTDRIRTHLERHGYIFGESDGQLWWQDPNQPCGCDFNCHEAKYLWLEHSSPLTGFLEDASKTGARIQDLCDHGPGKEIGPVQIYGTGYFDSEDPTNEEKHWRGYCTYASDGPTPSPTGDAKTVDASVADCWRRIFIDQEQP